MSEFQTVFGSLNDYAKGEIRVINDDPKNYVFSNIFDVASRSAPYEKVVVGINLEYVIEAVRTEGVSGWYAVAHDEFAIIMDGEVRIDLVKLDNPHAVVAAGKQGAVQVKGVPAGKKMGHVVCKRGHQALLPAGSAYRFTSLKTGVMMLQTMLGDLSVQKWSDICYK